MPDGRAAQTPGAVFSRRVAVDDASAREGLIEATAAERARLAAFCGVEDLARLSLVYRLEPLASHRYRLTGELAADLTQACVITLEPVEERIREAVALEFWPEHQLSAAPAGEDAEAAGEPAEPPEPIVAGRIDLGALAAEILASAINPYPRKADAEFIWHEGADEVQAGEASPFAALAKLRPDR